MADLLTHVLAAYVVLTVVGWRVDWLADRWVVVGMGGAILPDLTRLQLVIDDGTVSEILGVPFTYGHLDAVGGVLLTAGVVVVAFERRWWRRAYGLLVVGGLSHLVLDGMVVYADGRASQWLFPLLPSWRPPTPNLYVTADPLVPVVALAVTALVVWLDRTRFGEDASDADSDE